MLKRIKNIYVKVDNRVTIGAIITEISFGIIVALIKII